MINIGVVTSYLTHSGEQMNVVTNPKTDVITGNNQFLLRSSLPGVSPDKLQINMIDENVIEISGETDSILSRPKLFYKSIKLPQNFGQLGISSYMSF